jgi:NAD(P)-dependent dehydrogenase (short-subunit alcohol dehydrogenase family)
MSTSDGKSVAVVTGASRGVGLAIATRLASIPLKDFHVVLCARSSHQLAVAESQLRQAGASVSSQVCDVSDEADVQALADAVLGAHGRCDVLVNNAGIGETATPLHEMDVDRWDEVMRTNLRGPYLTLRAFAPAMIAAGRGHIVHIGSLAGKSPLPNGAAYAASKWGSLGMMLSAAEELRGHGVRVSIVSPGSIATGFGGTSGKDDSWKIAPEDIAEVVAGIVQQSGRSFISEVLVRPLHKPKA